MAKSITLFSFIVSSYFVLLEIITRKSIEISTIDV